jgi:tetratricopeptide (TPR) repeat protein
MNTVVKLGRNDPCSCGSGRKYKRCCGQQSTAAPSAQPQHPGDATNPAAMRAGTPAGARRGALTPAHIGVLGAHMAAGRHAESERCARELLSLDPNAGLVWKVLGLALWMQGKDALTALAQAATLLPQDAEAHTNLGNAFRAAGRLEEAVQSHRRSLSINPRYAEAHNNLGSALRELGRLDEAAASYRRAVAIKPDFAMAHANLSDTLQRAGQLDDAVDALRRVTELQPDSALAHCNLGDALRVSWRLDAAVACYRHALALKGDYAEAHDRLGNALFFLGQQDEAAASCRRALALRPDIAEVHSNLGMVLMVQGRMAEAEANCRRALELDPQLTGAIVMLAELHANKGQFAEAETLLQQAIALEPDMPEAWAGLVRWRKLVRADERWLAQAQRIVSQKLPPRREVHLRYALGKYFDEMKEFEQAFINYRRANELTRRHNASYDRQALSRRVDRIIERYDREFLGRTAADGNRSDRPVFVLGMWRSGTTLAEQILASHPAVFGAGELAFWGTAAGTYEQTPLVGATRGEHDLRDLASAYLALLEAQSADARHVTDKMCSNFLHLGLIRAALPNARIIHLQRNPIDTCLSIYFQDFHYGHLYANDLGDLAHYYTEYLRVMAHWRRTLPDGAMLEVPYESLVADQIGWTRRMLDFIGLPWDPRCVDFHRTERAVATVSKWQVRQRISNSSVERWRNYEPFVAPLLTLAAHAAGTA